MPGLWFAAGYRVPGGTPVDAAWMGREPEWVEDLPSPEFYRIYFMWISGSVT